MSESATQLGGHNYRLYKILFLPTLSELRLFVCNFCFDLHSDPFQYDPKKNLACMGNQSCCYGRPR